MKFLIFNIAILGALYYLFTADANGVRDMTSSAHQAVDRIETIASSAVEEARKLASKSTSVKESAPPVLAPKPEPRRIVPSPVKTVETTRPVPSPATVETPPPPLPPEPVEMIAEKAERNETTDAVPQKSLGERRKELLNMAQNMELFYLRKAGE